MTIKEAERIIRLCAEMKVGDRMPDAVIQVNCVIITALLDDLRGVPE